MKLSILANFIFVIAALIVALVLGKELFVPLAFAILVAFLLYPASKFLEKKLPRVLSIAIVFLLTTAIIFGVFTLFSFLFKNVITNIKYIDIEFRDIVNTCAASVSSFFGVEQGTILQMLEDNAGGMMEAPLGFFSDQIINSTAVLFSGLITAVLAFLLILYRTAFKNFIVFQLDPSSRDEAQLVMKDIQSVSQQYIIGIGKAMLVLGLLNSLGLWIIGVKFPLFWGIFAAFLAIIPFVGTFIGGFLPFIFAIATTGTVWQPVAVVLMFSVVQFLDDNFITPKIVGKNVDINPFVAIISLIFGGIIWGIPGIVLSLPYVAVLKIILDNFAETQSISALMSSEVYNKPNIFKQEFSDKKYSITNLFKLKKRKTKS